MNRGTPRPAPLRHTDTRPDIHNTDSDVPAVSIGRTLRYLIPLAAAGVLTFVAVNRLTVDHNDRDASSVATARAPIAGIDDDGQPTEPSAMRAGARFATLMTELVDQTPTDAIRLLGLLVTPNFLDRYSFQIEQDLVPIQQRIDALPGHSVLRQAVLAVNVDSIDGTHAQVSVWMLTTLAQVGVDVAPLGAYSTQTMTIEWDGNWWRLDNASSQPGPTPLSTAEPSTTAEFDSRLAGFVDWA